MRKAIYFGLLAVAIAGAVWLAKRRGEERPDPRATAKSDPTGGAMPVYTAQVQPRALQELVTATGTVTADEAIELVSEIAGKIVKLEFEEGSPVKRGDLLVQLYDAELAAQVERAQSRLELALAQAERQKQLAAAGGTSQADLDAAESEAMVLRAEVELAKAQLAKTQIRAPFDGVVGLRYVSVGANITPNTRIATLQKLDTVKVEFSIAERYLGRVQPNAEVTIRLTGLEEAFKGRLYAIEPRIDEATRTLRLRARAENPGGRALPGGFATVELTLREIPNALLVPADAIIPGLNEQQVYVLEDGRAQPRKVQTGLRLAREVQILSGLESNAVVITSGQLQLRPGMPVVAVERPGTVEAKIEDLTAKS
jgi:RND family efflux transporter, MFP subunit